MIQTTPKKCPFKTFPFETLIGYIMNALMAVAMIFLFILLAVTCIDVVGRYFFNNPLTGSTELTEMSLGILVFTAIPIVSYKQLHITVDILDSYISTKVKYWITQCYLGITVFAFIYITQYLEKTANRMLRRNSVSEYLEIPQGYIILYAEYTCYITMLLLILLMIKNFMSPQNFDGNEVNHGH